MYVEKLLTKNLPIEIYKCPVCNGKNIVHDCKLVKKKSWGLALLLFLTITLTGGIFARIFRGNFDLTNIEHLIVLAIYIVLLIASTLKIKEKIDYERAPHNVWICTNCKFEVVEQ